MGVGREEWLVTENVRGLAGQRHLTNEISDLKMMIPFKHKIKNKNKNTNVDSLCFVYG